MAGSLDPEDYKKTPKGNFNVNNDIEDIMKAWKNLVNFYPINLTFIQVSDEDWCLLKEFILDCLKLKISTSKELQKAFIRLRRQHKKVFKKNNVLHVLRSLESDENFINSFPEQNIKKLKTLLTTKAQKSTSGVLVVTVITSPYPEVNGVKQAFSCEWNCYYCPDEPGQPRSYLHDEPSLLRANRNHFDAVLQFYDRTMTLSMNGHPIDKVELLILGGTWSSYPISYQETFIRDLFYAANTFFCETNNRREKLSLREEKLINETTKCKIIGITLETRPDCITLEEIKRYRKYGCTRVQLGIQHTDDYILKKINRGCYRGDIIKAIKLLKNSCYKIDIHLMPNLPFTTSIKDKNMFLDVLFSSELQVDQWKIYPCEVVPWTVIQKWYESGKHKPYPEEELIEVLKFAKRRVHPWIRLNRVIRDIPSQYILGGLNKPSMRQEIAKIMEKEGKKCRCIRCREVNKSMMKNKENEELGEACLKVRKYIGSEGLEYFISFETYNEDIIYGFVRLRIPENLLSSSFIKKYKQQIIKETGIKPSYLHQQEREQEGKRRRGRPRSKTPVRSAYSENREIVTDCFPELKGAALIRELHVYGKLVPALQEKKRFGIISKTQHVGFGTRLMRKAEEIAKKHEKVEKIAVISGVGVRNFYRKLGYSLQGESEMMILSLGSNRRSQHLVRFIEFFQSYGFFVVVAFVVLLLALLVHSHSN